MSATEQGLKVAAVYDRPDHRSQSDATERPIRRANAAPDAVRCALCKEVHGPKWGRRECANMQQIYRRMAMRYRRSLPPMARNHLGQPSDI